jgi:hypothetical protein
VVENGVEKNDVIDGQQRLTTLSEFYRNRLRLVGSKDAPYLSPNSIHYAGKIFDELPEPYQQAFRRYRLTIIKLRDLGHMRLEIFRRINQGGTPLSGQDNPARLLRRKIAVAGIHTGCGVYDQERPASKRLVIE